MNGNYYYGFSDTYWFLPDYTNNFAFRFLAIDSDNRWTVGDTDSVWSISSTDSVESVENPYF